MAYRGDNRPGACAFGVAGRRGGMEEPDGRQDRAFESGEHRACEAEGRAKGGLVDARLPRIVLCAVPAGSPQVEIGARRASREALRLRSWCPSEGVACLGQA